VSAETAIIELSTLSVRYGARTALDGLDATIMGGAVGLLGPNGAGKSTLIKTLLGCCPPAAGRAKVLGEDVATHAFRLRRRVGYMPERDAAFPGLTGFQAVFYAGRLCGMPEADARRRAHEVLLFAGLEEARYREVSTYSTGMRQRVKLAQSLVHDPDLLFLDEPTNGLDPKGRREMLELIRELAHRKGIHVVLSSHLLRDVEEVCHSVVVLQGGKLVRHEQLSTLARGAPDACAVRIAGDPRPSARPARASGLPGVIDGKERELEIKLTQEGVTAPCFAGGQGERRDRAHAAPGAHLRSRTRSSTLLGRSP
jgi:ABC-2 type transport system ATP-binding protein